MLSVPVLRPDLVFVYFTERSRHEFVDLDNNYIRFNANRIFDRGNAVHKMLDEASWLLTSPAMDEIIMLKNYKIVEMLADSLNIEFLFTQYGDAFNGVEGFIDKKRHLPYALAKLDTARDHMHPGRGSHKKFAERALPSLLEILGGASSGCW